MTDRTPAEQIKEAREARGWTRAEAAARLGVGFSTLESWEMGRRTPKPYSLPGILEAIRTTPDREQQP